MCPGCYKAGPERYCGSCRKQLFDGGKVSHILSFGPPGNHSYSTYDERTKAFSISGVQLKYSLRLEGNKLVLTEEDGQYILKPVPVAVHIRNAAYAPENEHLTMQIAARVFNIDTAANALIYFSDGTPAYITRRFDIRSDGTRFLQEDMAQLSRRSSLTHGAHFKYDGTYEEIGNLIRQYVVAYHPAVEAFFKMVVFNYLFSNGDAHLKNFSLIETAMGDYTLTKVYDLMATVLHTPDEPDTALDLYKDDIDSPFYSKYGCYGREDFIDLADRVGILPVRAKRILSNLLSSKDKVLAMVRASFLNDEMKQTYEHAYLEKLKRMNIPNAPAPH